MLFTHSINLNSCAAHESVSETSGKLVTILIFSISFAYLSNIFISNLELWLLLCARCGMNNPLPSASMAVASKLPLHFFRSCTNGDHYIIIFNAQQTYILIFPFISSLWDTTMRWIKSSIVTSSHHELMYVHYCCNMAVFYFCCYCWARNS